MKTTNRRTTGVMLAPPVKIKGKTVPLTAGPLNDTTSIEIAVNNNDVFIHEV